jgi:hypothetical protein
MSWCPCQGYTQKFKMVETGNPYGRGKLCTVDLLVLTAPLDIEKVIYFVVKQATLMKRSTVLSLPVQLGIPG